jgi:hypothetical protein
MFPADIPVTANIKTSQYQKIRISKYDVLPPIFTFCNIKDAVTEMQASSCYNGSMSIAHAVCFGAFSN